MNLKDHHGCIEAFDDCANGLAELDHWWNACLDMLEAAEETWSVQDSRAHAAVKDRLRSGVTAAEVKAEVSQWVRDDATARKAWDDVRELRKMKNKLERFYRSCEKRGNLAQSAQNGHKAIAEGGGNTAPGPKDLRPGRPYIDV